MNIKKCLSAKHKIIDCEEEFKNESSVEDLTKLIPAKSEIRIQLLEKVALNTSAGFLIPSYQTEDIGRNKLSPVTFFKSGALKTLPLQKSSLIHTPLGSLDAELVTFYESGYLKKVFPLNGKISGYWTEKDEYALAKSIEIDLPSMHMRVKPIHIHFYENGSVKSITFWPGEECRVSTSEGIVQTHRGISFYPDGSISSVEPKSPIIVKTPLGYVQAYDPDPIGINGEKNSLVFNHKGHVEALKTVSNTFTFVTNEISYSPKEIESLCSSDEFVLLPLSLKFYEDKVCFKQGHKILGTEKISNLKDVGTFQSLRAQELTYSCG